MSLLYDRLAKDYHLLFPVHMGALGLLCDCAGQPPGRVLDAGCASGEYSAALDRRGYEAYGVESGLHLCTTARERHPHIAGRLVHGGLAEVFDLVRGPLALAFCIDGALCELATEGDVAGAVSQLWDLTRPAGQLVLELPNFDHLESQARRLRAETSAPAEAGEVRYGGLLDSLPQHGSPQSGSLSDSELRLSLPPITAYRDDGAELRLERWYSWLQPDGELRLEYRFSAPEGESEDVAEPLPLPRARLEPLLPAGVQASWLGDYDGAPWSEDHARTVIILR